MVQLGVPSKYYLRNFVPPYHYHIYNRGAHKQDIFRDPADYSTYLDIIQYYLRFPTGKPLSYKNQLHNKETLEVRNLQNIVENSFSVIAFCLMPNHFHFLLKQNVKHGPENSITNFMRRATITYSMYFNEKYEHSGAIFQGRYKNVIVTSQEQLLQLTRYMHLNPTEILTNKSLSAYQHSSYPDYIATDKKIHPWINNTEILRYFSNKNQQLSYKAFCESNNKIPQTIQKLVIE